VGTYCEKKGKNEIRYSTTGNKKMHKGAGGGKRKKKHLHLKARNGGTFAQDTWKWNASLKKISKKKEGKVVWQQHHLKIASGFVEGNLQNQALRGGRDKTLAGNLTRPQIRGERKSRLKNDPRLPGGPRVFVEGTLVGSGEVKRTGTL